MEKHELKTLNVIMSIDAVTGGGTAERTVQLSRAFVKAGHNNSILTTDIGFNEKRAELLKETNVIALPCINRRFYLPRFSYQSIRQIVANIDIIQLVGHWTFVNVLIYLMARQQDKPYVLCPCGALPIYGRSKLIKRLYNLVVGGNIVKNANGLIAITTDEIEQFLSYRVDKNRINVIPNGVNVEDFQVSQTDEFRKRYNLVDCPFILFMGRLNHIKGPDLLLSAFCAAKEKLGNYHLVFVGPDGGMLPELKKIAASFNVSEHVHFLGYLGGELKSQAYHAAELLVIPSRQEAMSIVVLEAGAAGTPVLLTDQCGFNEVGNISGGKVVSATIEGLQQGLIEMLSTPESLPSMGRNLKNFVAGDFSWEIAAKKYVTLYQQILNQKP
jgi:glycosyltransferase involved in cell wall biosynthesis